MPALATLLALSADLALVGVVVSPVAERSVAVLRSGQRTRVAAVGERAFGATVLAVAADRARLDVDGQAVELRLGSAGATTPVRPVAEARTAPAEPEAGGRSFARQDVQRRLATEIPRILAETALAPYRDGDEVRGLTIVRMPDGSLLSDAGLRTGDVLTTLNDTPVDSMAALISLWPRLQNESELRATVLRGGQTIPLVVNLR